MVVSKEEQDKKILEILNNNYLSSKEDIKWGTFALKEYAKWYAKKVIDRCAEAAQLDKEVVRNNMQCTNRGSKYIEEKTVIWEVDKQSILKVKKEL